MKDVLQFLGSLLTMSDDDLTAQLQLSDTAALRCDWFTSAIRLRLKRAEYRTQPFAEAEKRKLWLIFLYLSTAQPRTKAKVKWPHVEDMLASRTEWGAQYSSTKDAEDGLGEFAREHGQSLAGFAIIRPSMSVAKARELGFDPALEASVAAVLDANKTKKKEGDIFV